MPFNPRQAADSHTLAYEGQSLDDLAFWSSTSIEDRAFGFGKGSTAGFAFVSLLTFLGLAVLLDILDLTYLRLPVITTIFVGTEITNVDKCRHNHPS